ncbi:hypothetical protein DFR24_4429 [Panacagrimonas perspica]|uniref:Uncharacterized protein n=1 Tax=Panacagrimonas perspica TaxID=381431 RepID=A0A4R7NSX0_9GAMM|nr:hypothetical protein [Panacagrimonas perspica]TDU24165.1 hypothetical protein DFR24_4429 [Panacagrimonas perspica]THD04579.1 hypothetical protein B1810_03940 [Panacagrimonas perspica]
MTRKDLNDLPPLARAEAMDRPYRPGQRRRRMLMGAVVIAALLAAFLASMPSGAPKNRGATAAPDATPGVVYPNLHVSPQPPSRERDDSAAATATP